MKSAAALAVALALAAGPLLGRSLLTTIDGGQVLGDIEEEQLELTTAAGGDAILPRIALDRLRALPDGTVEATLKDGKQLVGALRTEITITDGLMKWRLQPADIREVAFDVFVPLTGKAEVICPIRALIELPAELVGGKLRSWTATRTLFASCDGHRVNSLEIARQKNVEVTLVGDRKPRKGMVFTIKPSVVLAPGEDQFVHLTFILVQGGVAIGQAVKQYSGDEGELNLFAPVQIWVQDERLDPGREVTLRYQMLTRERGTDQKAGPVFFWFVKIRL